MKSSKDKPTKAQHEALTDYLEAVGFTKQEAKRIAKDEKHSRKEIADSLRKELKKLPKKKKVIKEKNELLDKRN